MAETLIRDAVEYARSKRGIKVWIIEPANVLLDAPEARLLPVENHDYYAFHSRGKGLKDPSDRTEFAA